MLPHCTFIPGRQIMAGLPQAKVVYLLGAGKPCLSPCPLTPWTVTLSPAHCFLSGGISALEDSVFCVTPASAIPHIPVSSCPDSAGHQPGPLRFVERWAEDSRGWKQEVGSYCSSLVRVSGLFCGACVCAVGQRTPREPAQGRHVRRFHLDGDTSYNLGLQSPQSITP